jgi:hypothetical protein
MPYSIEDLKPQNNKFYAKHNKPNTEIKELEDIREKYLEKKIKYFTAKANTSSQSQSETT